MLSIVYENPWTTIFLMIVASMLRIFMKGDHSITSIEIG